MTTIVKHRRTGNEYILLGINGEAKAANPSRFISELFNQEKSEISCSATVCDVKGNMFLAYIDDLVVVEIDGIKPAEILPETTSQTVKDGWRSRSPKGLAPPGASVEVFQSPASEFEEEFEDEDEDEDELNQEQEAVQPAPLQSSVIESLDAPNLDQVNDDEDWI